MISKHFINRTKTTGNYIIALLLVFTNIKRGQNGANDTKVQLTFINNNPFEFQHTCFEMRPLSSKLYKENDHCCLSEVIERMDTPQSISYMNKNYNVY